MPLANPYTHETTYMLEISDGEGGWTPGAFQAQYTTEAEVHQLASEMYGGLHPDDYRIIQIDRKILTNTPPAQPAAPTTTEIQLDVCTPEGKTWLAEIVGVGGAQGIDRQFVNAVSSDLSGSGKTGTKTYVVENGKVYESNEGRKRFGRRFWIVADGEASEASRAEALARFR